MKRKTGSGPRAEPYRPGYADEQAKARRWSGSRLEREAGLRDEVLGRLAVGWSPAQVAGWLRRREGRTVIAAETIYRFVHPPIIRTNDGAWRQYLPRAKYRRGRRAGRGGSQNAIGRLRRILPRRNNLEAIQPDGSDDLACAYNHVPRRCLGFQTPAEVFSNVLHFKRDLTPA